MKTIKYIKVNQVRRWLSKPTGVKLWRLFRKCHVELDRFLVTHQPSRFNMQVLLKNTGDRTLKEMWKRLGTQAPIAFCGPMNLREYNIACPHDEPRILSSAEHSLAHKVNILGSGLVFLGENIDWHQDYKTGVKWPPAFFADIKYGRANSTGDVKFPWELSRMQWLIPLGQAYIITNEDRYAAAVKDILEHWMNSNPYGQSVNWACTMEAAIRIIVWIWFFGVFHKSKPWDDPEFQENFLSNLFLHGCFTERYIEWSDIRGNHFTADIAGLICAGLFFGRGISAERWSKSGWTILCEELTRQVSPDGVDFEGSIPYHRLVTELFYLPAFFRKNRGFDVLDSYRERLLSMALFIEGYSRSDGTIPLLGDADDGRVLPFGGQNINDHRYLKYLIGLTFNDDDLCRSYDESSESVNAENYWLLGPVGISLLKEKKSPEVVLKTQMFKDSGYYLMRNDRDHVFIDCGSVGSGGSGGHGHNDCLSFEAVLNGVHLVTDCGCYIYTASYEERNNFRSTAYHNTPQVNSEEINRFVDRENLWAFRNDALPEVIYWETGTKTDVFCGSHSGYLRLNPPVKPIRKIVLYHQAHVLVVEDTLEGAGIYSVSIPLHLAPGVTIVGTGDDRLELSRENRRFTIRWNDHNKWELTVQNARISPSYGVLSPVHRLVWTAKGAISIPLVVALAPKGQPTDNIFSYTVGCDRSIIG